MTPTQTHLKTNTKKDRIAHANTDKFILTKITPAPDIRQVKSMECMFMIAIKIMLIMLPIGQSQPISRPIVNRISISEADLGEL